MSAGLRIIPGRRVEVDGKTMYRFECPQCHVVGRCDEEQASGKVSCICPKCAWHETVAVHDDYEYFKSFDKRKPRKQPKRKPRKSAGREKP